MRSTESDTFSGNAISVAPDVQPGGNHENCVLLSVDSCQYPRNDRDGSLRMDERSQPDMRPSMDNLHCSTLHLQLSKHGSATDLADGNFDGHLCGNPDADQYVPDSNDTTSDQHRDTAESGSCQLTMEAETSAASKPANPDRQQPRVSTAQVKYPGIELQPETRPITLNQLVNEVKGIYVGLVMVESKCIEIDSDQGNTLKFTDEQWQALNTLHRTLLHEHHDFMLASQHPSGSPALRRLAQKYTTAAHIWRDDLHSFLEQLRRRLPDSQEDMTAFICLAYSMMSFLDETVPTYGDTLMKRFSSLSPGRMTIEDNNQRIHDTWISVLRKWYAQDSHRSPTTDRVKHHRVILTQSISKSQLYSYIRRLRASMPLTTAHESILTHLETVLSGDSPPVLDNTSIRYKPPDDILYFYDILIKVHALLFGVDLNSCLIPRWMQLLGNDFHWPVAATHSNAHICAQATRLFALAQWNRILDIMSLFQWRFAFIPDFFRGNYNKCMHLERGWPMAIVTCLAGMWSEVGCTKQSPDWWKTLCGVLWAQYVIPEDRVPLHSPSAKMKGRPRSHLQPSFGQNAFGIWAAIKQLQNMHPCLGYLRLKLAMPFDFATYLV